MTAAQVYMETVKVDTLKTRAYNVTVYILQSLQVAVTNRTGERNNDGINE